MIFGLREGVIGDNLIFGGRFDAIPITAGKLLVGEAASMMLENSETHRSWLLARSVRYRVKR